MKRTHRLAALMLALAMLLALCACGGAKEKSLKEQGLEVIALMEEMVNSEAYVRYHTGAEGLIRVVASMAEGDYSEPAAIYSLTPPEDTASVWDSSLQELEGLSDTLKEAVLQKTLGPALIQRINAMDGAEALAATAVCTAGKTFVCSEAEGDVTYLYVYETGYPIAVSFSEGENHAWSASGTFLINDRFDPSSQESIASFFAQYAIEVGVVS